MTKLDVKKAEKEYYRPSGKKNTIVVVPPMTYFMVDGEGTPGNESYAEAIGILYKAAYTLKMGVVKSDDPEKDYVVPPLEGFWYMDDMNKWSMDNKEAWQWTMCIRIPDHVSQEQIDRAIKMIDPKEFNVSRLRVEEYDEGESIQILYTGPYDQETETIRLMHEEAFAKGYRLHKHHHEIYLSDPRRTAPEKLKTVIRQPITK